MRTLRLDAPALRVESFDVDSLPQASPMIALPTLFTRMAGCCDPKIMAEEGQ